MNLRRIICLGLGVGGLALIVASGWMPWYHWGRDPLSAPPECVAPSSPIVWPSAVLAAVALGGLALGSPHVGMGTGSGSLLLLTLGGLGTGFIGDSNPVCGSSSTVQAYGVFVAVLGALLVTGASVLSWTWSR